MAEIKRADQVRVGEEFVPYEFRVTPEFNQQYLEAVEDHHPRYIQAVHPAPPLDCPEQCHKKPIFSIATRYGCCSRKGAGRILQPGQGW